MERKQERQEGRTARKRKDEMKGRRWDGRKIRRKENKKKSNKRQAVRK